MRTRQALKDLVEQLTAEMDTIAHTISNLENEIDYHVGDYSKLEDMKLDAEQELADLGMEELDL